MSADAWEHDGTNLRGISTPCQICGALLIRASESEYCAPCLIDLEDRIDAKVTNALATLRERERKS